jgi:hypothetical protein
MPSVTDHLLLATSDSIQIQIRLKDTMAPHGARLAAAVVQQRSLLQTDQAAV